MTHATPVPRQSRTPAASGGRIENLSLLLGTVGLVVGATAGLLLFHGHTPFREGSWTSVGTVAVIAGGVVAALSFLVALWRLDAVVLPWLGRIHPLRRVVTVGGLALLLGSSTVFALRGVNGVVAAAFIGLSLDRWAAATYVGAVCALAAYVSAAVAGRLGTELLSVLVAAFLVMGALLSAANASEPLWWQIHFSQLGMARDLAGFAFNYTLILAGIVIVTLADFLVHELRLWFAASGEGVWKVRFIRLGLVAMGAMLAGIGLLPVHVSHRGHLIATYGTVSAFVVLAVVTPVILRQIPWGFRIVSFATLAFMGVLWVLFREVRYLGTTGFEMFAVSVVLVWMMLFVRTLVAAARDHQGEIEAGRVVVESEQAVD